MISLDVIDANSQAIEAVLDDELFYIILDWNSSSQSWTMSLRNATYETLISGIALVVNYPLTRQFRFSTMPQGELYLAHPTDRNGPLPRDWFEQGYELVYWPIDEMIAEGVA
jgi:hypothetical protein